MALLPRRQYIPLPTVIRIPSKNLYDPKLNGINNSHTRVAELEHINPLNSELNPICHLLALFGAHHILHINRTRVNTLNAELSPICYLLALLGAHHFLHVSRIRVKLLTLRLLMSYIYIYIYIYIYGAPIIDVSRSHTTTQHNR